MKTAVFNGFYGEYIEYKNYLNDVIRSLSSREELLKTQEYNNNSQLKKINLLEKEIKNLKNVNQI